MANFTPNVSAIGAILDKKKEEEAEKLALIQAEKAEIAASNLQNSRDLSISNRNSVVNPAVNSSGAGFSGVPDRRISDRHS